MKVHSIIRSKVRNLLWPNHLDKAEFEKYLDWNRQQQLSLLFTLTARGFFSEISCLMNAMIYCLIHDMRLIVDTSRFLYSGSSRQAVDLDELFTLPLGAALKQEAFSGDDADLYSNGTRSDDFWTINHEIQKYHASGQRFSTVVFGENRSIFELKSLIAQKLFVRRFDNEDYCFRAARTNALTQIGLETTSRFACFHIRRGDKTAAFIEEQEQPSSNESPLKRIDGEAISPKVYFEKLVDAEYEPDEIFVMTDEYRLIEETASFAKGTNLKTLAQESKTGYWQKDFGKLTTQEKITELKQLLLEVQIAAEADVFVAGYRSNVARFVHLWSKPGQIRISVDRQANWNAL